jgi:transposase
MEEPLMPRKKSRVANHRPLTPGQQAKSARQQLTTYAIGAVPIINQLMDQMELSRFLLRYLPADRGRMRLPTATALLVVIRNLLVSREPIYGIGEWAGGFAPDVMGLVPTQLAHFNDDRLGRCLDRLFESPLPELVMAVARHVIKKFDLSLDELHNDSTTVSFYGSYEDAAEPQMRKGGKTVAITYGHSKDHRPDLKQLLYILTVTDDGGVPLYFATESGNTVDDQTHRETWDVLRQLVGSPAFLYVADCKLATSENMRYIDRKHGRFISVLPRTRKEDRDFRQQLVRRGEEVQWEHLYFIRDEQGDVADELSVHPTELLTQDKYRLWWYRSTRKARRDERSRLERIQRASAELMKLRDRLTGPRPRLRSREQVAPVVQQVLAEFQVEPWLKVEVSEYERPRYRQATAGRPGPNTRYIRESSTYCDLSWEIDYQAIEESQKCDGIFPLITNVPDMTAEEILRAYKRQPIIEKRFSQLKTDFEVAPVYLKNVGRIQALLCLYFFALMIQTLLERQLRRAMEQAGIVSLPLYPEGRDCKAPTARRVLDVFEPVQRHTITMANHCETLVTQLSPLQRRILNLLGFSAKDFGR